MKWRDVDLFAGTGSATAASPNRFRVEMDERFEAELHADVLDLDPRDLPGPFRSIWASPPCTAFSVGSFRHHFMATTPCRNCGEVVFRGGYEVWRHDAEPLPCDNPRPSQVTYAPKSETGRTGLALLQHTLDIIEFWQPRYWIIENPRALMRKMPELANVERRTITYCQYGDPRRMKPTDLFGIFPPGFEARACRNGDPCHEAAPRGAKTGTQGLSSKEAAMLPPLLSQELFAAMEAQHEVA